MLRRIISVTAAATVAGLTGCAYDDPIADWHYQSSPFGSTFVNEPVYADYTPQVPAYQETPAYPAVTDMDPDLARLYQNIETEQTNHYYTHPEPAYQQPSSYQNYNAPYGVFLGVPNNYQTAPWNTTTTTTPGSSYYDMWQQQNQWEQQQQQYAPSNPGHVDPTQPLYDPL